MIIGVVLEKTNACARYFVISLFLYNAVLCFSKSSNDVISVPISSWEFIHDQ